MHRRTQLIGSMRPPLYYFMIMITTAQKITSLEKVNFNNILIIKRPVKGYKDLQLWFHIARAKSLIKQLKNTLEFRFYAKVVNVHFLKKLCYTSIQNFCDARMSRNLFQDYQYFPYKNDSMVAIFVCFDASDKSNGGLAIYPGSHKLGPLEDHSNVPIYHYVDQVRRVILGGS